MLHSTEQSRGAAPRPFSPMEIAHHQWLTAREKLELLDDLKAQATGEHADLDALGFGPDDVDEAIAEVKRDAEAGAGGKAVLPQDR